MKLFKDIVKMTNYRLRPVVWVDGIKNKRHYRVFLDVLTENDNIETIAWTELKSFKSMYMFARTTPDKSYDEMWSKAGR